MKIQDFLANYAQMWVVNVSHDILDMFDQICIFEILQKRKQYKHNTDVLDRALEDLENNG